MTKDEEAKAIAERWVQLAGTTLKSVHRVSTLEIATLALAYQKLVEEKETFMHVGFLGYDIHGACFQHMRELQKQIDDQRGIVERTRAALTRCDGELEATKSRRDDLQKQVDEYHANGCCPDPVTGYDCRAINAERVKSMELEKEAVLVREAQECLALVAEGLKYKLERTEALLTDSRAFRAEERESLVKEREELRATVKEWQTSDALRSTTVARLKTAIDRALHEFGVPTPDYPAPVAKAVEWLQDALTPETCMCGGKLVPMSLSMPSGRLLKGRVCRRCGTPRSGPS